MMRGFMNLKFTAVGNNAGTVRMQCHRQTKVFEFVIIICCSVKQFSQYMALNVMKRFQKSNYSKSRLSICLSVCLSAVRYMNRPM